MVTLTASSVGAEGSTASAGVTWLSAGEGLLSIRGDSAGVLVFVWWCLVMASAARKSSSELRPNQSDALRSLDEEVGLGFFSRKAKFGSSEENLIHRMKFIYLFIYFYLNIRET